MKVWQIVRWGGKPDHGLQQYAIMECSIRGRKTWEGGKDGLQTEHHVETPICRQYSPSYTVP
jgi:hypothetical protein